MSVEEVAVETTEATTALGGEATTSTEPSFSNDQIFEMFKGSLGDDLKGHSYLGKYTNADDFVKAGINHQSSLTTKASDYFTSEEPAVVAERNKILGVPESADGYEISPELSEVVSEESLANFKAKAHEIGLPAKFLPELVKFEADLWSKHAENQEASAVAQKEEAIASLKEEWKGDTFDHNTKQVMNLMKEIGITDVDMTIPLGNNTALIKALHAQVVPLFGADKLIEGTMTQTMASAGDRIKQINTEMFSARQGTPEYKALMSEKATLMSKMS